MNFDRMDLKILGILQRDATIFFRWRSARCDCALSRECRGLQVVGCRM